MKKIVLCILLLIAIALWAQVATNLGPISIGGGAVISNSSNVAQTNIANNFSQIQTGNFANTGPIIDLSAFATVVCNNSVDDTAAFNAALIAAGSLHSPATMTYLGATHNARQGGVRLPANGKCLISAALQIPPGVFIDGNNATVKQTTANQDAFVFAYDFLGGYGYGSFWNGLRNVFIQGVGSGTSTGRGLFLNTSSFGFFQNIQVQGFKFGVTAWEAQYTRFDHVYASNNIVGFYLTARPTNTSLAALDNTFTDIMADLNVKYGIWAQCISSSQFDRVDASRNGSVDILLGSQLTPYISSYTVNNGGSGYALNSTLPVTITDAGGGLYAQAYAITNGSGVVTAVFGVDGGQGYVTPVVSVPGGGVAATVTANLTNDAGLGDWDGVSSIQRGSLTFNTVKTEHVYGVDGPNRGYAVVINGTATGAIRDVLFNNYQLQRQSGGNNPYYRLAFNQGFGNVFNWSGDSSGTYDGMSNPASAGDISIFRNVTSQGLTSHWNNFQGSVLKLTVDETGTVPYGGFRQSTIGFTGDGKVLAVGYHMTSSFGGAAAEESDVAGEANLRFQRDIDGTMHWGAGGGSATDTSLARGAANRLTTPGYLYMKALQVSGIIPGGLSAGLAQIGADPTAGLQLDGTGSSFDVTVYNSSNAHTAFAIPHGYDGVQVGQSVSSRMTQFDIKIGVAGCTTAASIGGVCATPITVTWNTTFVDNGYAAKCQVVGAPTNLPSTPYVVAKSPGSMTVNYYAISAAAASWPTIDCEATHP